MTKGLAAVVLHHHCCLASVMIAKKQDHGPSMVGTVLDSGSQVTAISEGMLRTQETQFRGGG